MNPVLIIGCGDIGQRVGRLYLKQDKNVAVSGLVRSEAAMERLAMAGIQTLRADLARPQTLVNLPTEGARIFYFAPPPATGDTDPLLRNFLTTLATPLPEKIVLISTTAVYGDCRGGWINEQRATHPQTDRGRRRLDAETALREWSTRTGVPCIILRVGGIYGPGRWPLERLQKGLPVLRESESPYTNRIHQDDLAQICLAAAERGQSGEVFNVTDGKPDTMSHYFKTVATHFGLPQPAEVNLAEAKKMMTAGMLSYLKESRKIPNDKLLEQLEVELRYPDLKAGLAAEKILPVIKS